MGSPFDRSLEEHALGVAAEAYARRFGDLRSEGYRTAWLEFRRRVRTIEDLHRWQSKRAAARRDTTAILDAALTRAMDMDGAPMGNAQLYEPRIPGLRMMAHRGFATRFVEHFRAVTDASTACGIAVASRQPVWVPDTADSPIFEDALTLKMVLDAGARAVVSLPAKSPDGRVIAIVSIHHRRPRAWTRRRRLELEQMVDSAGRILYEVMTSATALIRSPAQG
jgi:GAF domain-containing protein